MADWYTGNPYQYEFGLRIFPSTSNIYRSNGNYSTNSFTTFGGNNKAWHLYPVGRLEVEPPEVDIKMIDVAGGDSAIDMTDVLIGRPIYKTRKAEWTFKIVDDRSLWDTIYNDILNTLHGRRFKIIRQEEPYYYYEGRLSITSTKSDRYNGKVKISAILDAWKKTTQTAADDWLWNPFSFEDGYIFYPDNETNPNNYSVGWDIPECIGSFSIDSSPQTTVKIANPYGMPMHPVFNITTEAANVTITVRIGTDIYTWEMPTAGTKSFVIAEYEFAPYSETTMRFSASSDDVTTLTIDMRGGSL